MMHRHLLALAVALVSAMAAAETPRVLEEIIVTAQKRAQSLSDVPVSVTAVSAEKLSEAGIENLADLSEYVPNLKLAEGGLVPNIYMRGIGSGSNQGFELSVGIFADGIHLGRPHQTRTAFMDVQRVEVLRGPQSILFGKNAIAGAISVVSAQPGDEFAGMVSAGYGLELDKVETDAVLSGPLSDTVGARLALRYRDQEGYMYNPELDRLEGGAVEASGRMVLSWTPKDLLDASLKFEKTDREQTGRTLQVTQPSALTRCSGENTRADYVRHSDIDERIVLDAMNTTLNVNVHAAAGTLSSISGYTRFDNDEYFDPDSSSWDTSVFHSIEDYRQLSQELRFTSPGGELIDYIGGIFYQQSELTFDESAPLKVRNAAVQDTDSCELNSQVLVESDLDRDYLLDSQAWSAFTQITINFSERWRSTLGLRYVFETKEGYREFNLYERDTRMPINPLSGLVLSQLNVDSHQLEGERSSEVVLPLVNLQWDASENIMTYVAYTEGAKSGGYDARGNNANDGPTGGGTNFEFEDELADAWEVGAKMRLLDGSADLNIAVYRVEYSNMQVSVFDGVAGFNVTNAGSALTQGAELDGRWLATDWLMLTAAVGYLDFEWLSYEQGPCYPGSPEEDPDTGTCSFNGKVNQQTPRWTSSLSSTITLPVGSRHTLEFAVDVNYRDEHYIAGDLDPRSLQEALTKYHARVRVFDNDNTWWLTLAGKNLSEEMGQGLGAATGLDVGGYRSSTEPPRSVYLEAGLRF
ncbi:TonB-dependent receptor [Spongiibacter sp. KMU-166]|uniref:TonB-dependent receptor n=1 Tax=Spongiibacter thalassae TaxID=2721624 RepID=A0ABX1GJ74_9GAMM|nr:TonB-dependent receptor [Spongiibacter thalassae]NKI19255.1 TonB-dependent receptor [Spongiibacter thalassae]